MELTLGTGGMRAVLGEEDQKKNLQIAREIGRGILLYQKKQYRLKEWPRVAVTFDSGRHAEKFARETARILALEGCQVWIYPKAVPLPVPSFAVRYLGCDLGIGISSGYDRAEYIEYRIYGADGSRIMENEAKELFGCVRENPGNWPRISGEDFDSLREQGKILWMEEQVLKAFLRAALGCRVRRELAGNLRAVYTPLYGAGICCVVSALRHMKVTELGLVPEQVRPGKDLSTCSYLDPGEPENLMQGLWQCEERGADLLLATDLPGERVGVAVRKKEEYVVLTGDQVGVLLLDYLLGERDKKGTLPEHPIVVRSVTSTEMADRIARKYQAEVILTPPGFCYIGRAVSCLEEQGEENRFVFGFEESRSYLAGAYVREPEPVGICGLIWEMADAYKTEGKTLWNRLQELYEEYGCFETSQNHYVVSDTDKQDKMDQIRWGLQVNPDMKFQGRQVVRYRDYLEEETWFPQDLLELWLEDEARVVICPAKEEPKLTVYQERKTGFQKAKIHRETRKKDLNFETGPLAAAEDREDREDMILQTGIILQA